MKQNISIVPILNLQEVADQAVRGQAAAKILLCLQESVSKIKIEKCR